MTEIVFVDALVPNRDVLLSCTTAAVETRSIEQSGDPVGQIAAILSGRSGLKAIHIVAHGSDGRICFGGGDLSMETLSSQVVGLDAIGRALVGDGELLLWSCNVAQSEVGRAFVEALEAAIGADVAASDALVGSADLGGSWELAAGSATRRSRPFDDAQLLGFSGVLVSPTSENFDDDPTNLGLGGNTRTDHGWNYELRRADGSLDPNGY